MGPEPRGDLPRFMELGLSAADRVIAVCTRQYVDKASQGLGGVGYEQMILTAQLMKNVNSDHIIPLIRNNEGPDLTPVFLSSKKYIDFRNDSDYEARYGELIYEIHGQKIKPRPVLGKNPFEAVPDQILPRLSFAPERYVSPAKSGIVTFDYSNNNGRYVVGAGDFAFETAWSRASNTSIYAYSDPPSIRSVAIATGITEMEQIDDASIFYTSSRVRSSHLGEIVVWQDTAGYYLATKIEKLQSRGHGYASDEITFSYIVQTDKTASFRPSV